MEQELKNLQREINIIKLRKPKLNSIFSDISGQFEKQINFSLKPNVLNVPIITKDDLDLFIQDSIEYTLIAIDSNPIIRGRRIITEESNVTTSLKILEQEPTFYFGFNIKIIAFNSIFQIGVIDISYPNTFAFSFNFDQDYSYSISVNGGGGIGSYSYSDEDTFSIRLYNNVCNFYVNGIIIQSSNLNLNGPFFPKFYLANNILDISKIRYNPI